MVGETEYDNEVKRKVSVTDINELRVYESTLSATLYFPISWSFRFKVTILLSLESFTFEVTSFELFVPSSLIKVTLMFFAYFNGDPKLSTILNLTDWCFESLARIVFSPSI